MEKLIELLNEWSKTAIKNKCNWTDVYDEDGIYFVNLFDRDMTMEMEDVISKRNGFIKWLVENDKIDLKKLDKKAERKPQYTFIDDDGRLGFKLFEVYESLLMLLSISDTSIEDLLLYLK